MLKWIFFLLFCPIVVNATNFYVSNAGNDANPGTSTVQAWKSIERLNQSFGSFTAGDTVFFRRNDIFYGSIKVAASGVAGRPIVITAYGSGANPLISGFSLITGWVSKKSGIWEAPAPKLKNNLNMVTRNGYPQRLGRFPNADAEDGGYLRYENFNINISISDDELNDKINWTGAEVVIRKNHWTAERCRVTKHEGNTIFYTYGNEGVNATKQPPLYNGLKGNGYFFQKDIRTLDQPGEWFLDTVQHTLQMYLSKTDLNKYSIKASSIDTLVDVGNRSFISISQLDFEGAGMSGIYARLAADITVEYCNFRNMGAKAIHIWNSPNIVIDHVNTNYVMSNAIQVRNSKQHNVSITNCVVKNTGIYLGMGSFFDDRDYKALTAVTDRGLLIANNQVDTSGLSAIQFQGSDAIVRNNLVNYFCYLLDDGAGIYTYSEVSKENPVVYTNRIVHHNIVLNGIGASEGSIKTKKAEGIYLDGGTMNIEVSNNTIAHIASKAIATNNPSNVNILHNTCFNTGGGWGTTRLNVWETLKSFNVIGNIFYSMDDQQRLANFTHSGLDVPTKVTVWEAIRQMGVVDSNYYHTLNPAAFNYTFAPEAGKAYIFPTPLSFENWKALTGQDVHSRRPARIVPGYVLKATTGSNLVRNGDFSNDITGAMVFGKDAEGQWDNAGKLAGKGSLKLSFIQPQANRYVMVHGPVGNVASGKKYVLRFKTAGTTPNGIVRAYLRKTSTPFTNLAPTQTKIFGVGKESHEFFFAITANEAASYVIEVEKNSGTTYLDDVELMEASGSVIELKKQVLFEYNAADEMKTISLDRNYIGVDGTKYSKAVNLAPWSSVILIAEELKY